MQEQINNLKKQVKGQGKGKQPPAVKGQGKGKTKKGGQPQPNANKPNKAGEHRFTEAGKEICFAFQRGDCKGCQRVHCCTFCFGKHKGSECPSRPSR